MDEVAWWRFWRPQSGARGGAILGTIIGVTLVTVLVLTGVLK